MSDFVCYVSERTLTRGFPWPVSKERHRVRHERNIQEL